MPRDYKSNTYRSTRRPKKKQGLDSWDRVLIVILITALALVVKYFIVGQSQQLSQVTPQNTTANQVVTPDKLRVAGATVAKAAQDAASIGNGLSKEELNAEAPAVPQAATEPTPKMTTVIIPTRQDSTPAEPHFDFYNILPAVDVEIADHELKTRVREEKLGEVDKNAKYIMQAGSFPDVAAAEQRKAKLSAIGIESRIEKAQVGEVFWYRVKVGPYTGMSSIMTVKAQLHDTGVDAIVMEYKE